MKTSRIACARRTRTAPLSALFALTVLLVADVAAAQPIPVTPAVVAPRVSFRDVSATAFNPPFVHNSSVPQGDGLGGAAWFDYDRDGFLDLFLVGGKGQNNALYRNNGNGTFTDVAAAAGVQNGLGNAAVVPADLDNDGDQDLFLTGDGGFLGTGDTPFKLYRNDFVPGVTPVTFTDVTAASGIGGLLSQLDATFGDVDNDGLLDLFVTASGSFCPQGPNPPICNPGNHPNQLFRNLGGLTFQNVSAGSGVDTALGGCTAFFGHYDNDPFIDLYLGNCNGLTPANPPNPWPLSPVAAPNQLFQNGGGLTFTDVAPSAGFATFGLFMGFAPADFNNDQLVDIFATNLGPAPPPLGPQPHAFYLKTGNLVGPPPPVYTDLAAFLGVAGLEFGWGTTAPDFDNDGWADLYYSGSMPPAGILGNPGRMFINQLPATAALTDITSTLPATANLSTQYSSGTASADYDNDGDTDLVVVTDVFGGTGGAPLLLRNQINLTTNPPSSLTICVEGDPSVGSNRDGVGARVAVQAVIQGAPILQLREVYAGSGFLSHNSQWLTFGLDDATTTTLIVVWWPNNVVETFPNATANQQVRLVQGTGVLQPGC
ncbi:MAG: CRTAC1 family protein [Acidobacteria bacterium]|nr:CRTAC1 family protein [Acidobacteriota bacterium]